MLEHFLFMGAQTEMIIVEKIIDLATQTETIVEREMTPEEFKQWEADQAETITLTAARKEAEAKKTEAEAKLTALGLTTEDLRALGL